MLKQIKGRIFQIPRRRRSMILPSSHASSNSIHYALQRLSDETVAICLLIVTIILVGCTFMVFISSVNLDIEASSPKSMDFSSTKGGGAIASNQSYKVADGRHVETESSSVPNLIDFYVAGFPKSGTTSLLYAFNAHNETSISGEEYCGLDKRKFSTDESISHLKRHVFDHLDLIPNVKRGVKCPTSIFDAVGLRRLSEVSPGIKVLVGVRNPVKFFTSFYNYRVTEMYDRGERYYIPPPETLIKSEWKKVSADMARFELSLLQYNKTGTNQDQLNKLVEMKKSVQSIPSRIFIYDIEQLEDKDEERAAQFRSDMQHFLGLTESLEPFPHENVNRRKKQHSHPEYVDICHSAHDGLRKFLLNQASETGKWIKEEFIFSPDVIAGGKDYFLELED
uniref:Sulfotransferase domain-containing protein n=1 Tax=Leptocylindrus danicus TaxID=163516 RepID=A0A7S2JTW0_9STRA|mmetsp:Transcript_1155/g.1660  ORF Transcript_1155/g.1660 Transcript_1155/m.1660 type:complete len:394 (+) Transcript_1155:1881-3062(+)